MSELEYDNKWAAQLVGAGLTPPSTPVNLRGVIKTMLANWPTGGGGSGTVTSVSVVSANGLAATIATPTTTPAITLSTTITGVLKGNGTAISAAAAGTDYIGPTSGSAIQKASAGGLTAATAGTDYPATGVITGAGPIGSSIAIPVITYNANGQLTTVSTTGTVGSVAATDSSIVVAGTGTAPTIQRAALTGDVTASAGSNATSLVGTAGVQGIIRTYRVALTGDATAAQDSNAVSVVQVQGVAITAAEATLVSQLNGATTRAASASAVAGEQTVLTGTTASQTLTLPASTAQVSSPNLVINNSTQNWTIAFGAGTTGNRFGVAGSFNLNAGSFVEFYLIGTVWYMTRYSLAPPLKFTSGTPTWIPSGTGNAIFSALLVAGGSAGQTGSGSTGGVGGSGGEVIPAFYLGNVTANQTVTIGTGGATSLASGNNTSIGALVIATGGTFVGDGSGVTVVGTGGKGGTGAATSAAGGTGGPGTMRYGCGAGGGGGPTTGGGGPSGGSAQVGAAGGGAASLGGGGGGAINLQVGTTGTAGVGGAGATASANTGGGGGGGGAGTSPGAAGAGGSGVVIITQQA